MRTLGELAWKHLPSISIELKPGKEIKKIRTKLNQIQQKTSKQFSELQKRLEQERTKSRDELTQCSELTITLAEVGKKLKKVNTDIKATRKKLSSEKSKLKKLDNQISELEKPGEGTSDTDQDAEKAPDPAAIEKQREELSKEAASVRKQVASVERKLKNLDKSKQSLDEQLGSIEEQIGQRDEIRKEFREKISGFESEQKKLQAEATKQSKPLEEKIFNSYIELGEEISNNRHAHSDLDAVYAQIDLSKTTIEMLGEENKAESVLLDLLDESSVILFYVISGSILIVALFLMILITFSIVNLFI